MVQPGQVTGGAPARGGERAGLLGRPGITRQMLAWFIVVALLPMLAATGVIYYHAGEALRLEAGKELSSASERQSRQIVSYLRAHESSVTTLARAPEVVRALREFQQAALSGGMDSARYREVDTRLRPYLSYYQESFGYDDLLLVSAQGRVLFSARQGGEPGADLRRGIHEGTELTKAFDRASTLLETGISDFGYSPVTGQPAAFIASPVLDSGQLSGVAILQISNQQLYRIINDYSGLGQSGETVVASRQGQQALFQAPTRHDPQAAFTRSVELGQGQDQGVEQAVRGGKGQGLVRDYRGQECLAVWRYIPEMRWGMVVKIDAAEALAPVAQLRSFGLVVAGITLVAVTVLAFLVAHSLSAPLRRLTALARVVAGGDLQQKVEVAGSGEIAELAQAFNHMTEQLSHSMEELKATTAAKERIESELDIAREIQMSLVPKTFPPYPHRPEFDILATLRPARQVGGDLYDFFFLDDDHFCFLVGDVSGKGVPASLFMAVARTLIKAVAAEEHEPDRLISRVNQELCQGNEACMFVTLFLAIAQVSTGQVSYANAGHNPPVVLGTQGAAYLTQQRKSPPLGVVEFAGYPPGSLRLAPGQTLVLYTDGVTEANNAAMELFGDERLLAVLKARAGQAPPAVMEAVLGAVEEFVGGEPQADDITLLLWRYRGPAAPAASAAPGTPSQA